MTDSARSHYADFPQHDLDAMKAGRAQYKLCYAQFITAFGATVFCAERGPHTTHCGTLGNQLIYEWGTPQRS